MTRLGLRLAGLALRRGRLVVALWLLVVGVLAMQGGKLESKLGVHLITVDGTQSARVHQLVSREFGNELAMTVMLRGPANAVEAQGRRLAARLARHGRFTVLSPWSPGVNGDRLRPAPGVAAIIARADGIDDTDTLSLLAPIERDVEATIEDPVRVGLAGLPAIFKSTQIASEDAAASSELIAIPVLLLVLLFVFRSVVAALIPAIVGGAVVAATRGVLSLLTGVVEVDLVAAGVVGMMGLALGVDYSLLVISRFREARRQGGGEEDVMRTAVVASARAIVPAGCGLLLAMAAAALLYPVVMIQTVAIAVGVVSVLSVVSALCVVPAMLAVLGDNLDRWSLRELDTAQVAPLRWSRRLTARPGAVAAVVAVMVLLSTWALSLDSGLASARFLPEGTPGRVGQEEVEQELGPGWVAPIEVAVNGRGSPVTQRGRLRALARFERRVGRDPGVDSVIGFAPVERRLRPLGDLDDTLAKQQRGIEGLGKGISRLHDGAVLNDEGMLAAAEGARKIYFGVGATKKGSGFLADSLQAASAGSQQLGAGLGRASAGSGRLLRGAAKASSGADRLAKGLAQARRGTGEVQGGTRLLANALHAGEERLVELDAPLEAGEAQLDAAWQALQRMTVGRNDPQYEAALRAVAEADRSISGQDVRSGEQADPAYAGVDAGVERALGQFETGLYLADKLETNGSKAADGIAKLAKGSAQLDSGLRRLEHGARGLSQGIEALDRGGEKLSPGLVRLSAGASALAGGLAQLEGGAGQLADGLGGGAQKSKLLSGGLRRISLALERQDGGGSNLGQLQQASPGLFDSGYFDLAALDGGTPERRRQLGFLLNLDRGGDVARMLVIPSSGVSDPGAADTTRRVESDAADLSARTGTEVAVGGIAPGIRDAETDLRDQILSLRLALSLVSFLILLPVVRSLTIAVLAALLNLLAASACFGVLALVFDDSLLGGPGFVDITVMLVAIVVLFGLAIDYEVFFFSRMREEYVRTGSPLVALENGLDRTAHVITGAATIMIATFLSFSISDLISLRNFGIAQALGVFFDAFVIRLLVFPALLRRLGAWAWWMPAWLDRLLPGGSGPPSAKPGAAAEPLAP